MKRLKNKLSDDVETALAALADLALPLSGNDALFIYDAARQRAVGGRVNTSSDRPFEDCAPWVARWREGDDQDLITLQAANGDHLGFVAPVSGAPAVRDALHPICTAAEKILEQARESDLLLGTLDAIPDPVAVHGPGGVVLFANAADGKTGADVRGEARVCPMKDGNKLVIESREVTMNDRETALTRAYTVIARAERLAKLGYFVFDTQELRMTHLSPGIYAIATSLDPAADGLTYEQLLDRVHPADRDRVVRETWASIHENKELDIEFRTLTVEGDIQNLWLTESSLPVGPDGGTVRVGIVQDITERIEREAALKENIAFRQAATKTALDCVVTIDSEGVIKEFNPAAEKTFGFDAQEVIGRPLAETIIPVSLRDKHLQGLKHYLETGEHNVLHKRVEVPAIRADGTDLLVELAITPFDVNGNRYFTAYLRDITEAKHQQEVLKASEEELRTAKEQAEAANEAKSRFLAMMSHEIRTPLNGVIGGLSLLRNSPLNEEQQAHAKLAREAADGLLTLVNDLLDFERIEAGHVKLKPSDFDLWDCVSQVADVFKLIAQSKDLPVLVNIEQDVPRYVRSDATRLRQILLNLVSNAVKFTETGSVQIRVTADEGGTELRFEVEDTGIGIPQGLEDRLFGEFVQLESDYRRRFGGAGLGLAISKSLCTLMDGSIGCESVEGEGSLFWFTVSVEPASAAQDAGPDRTASQTDLSDVRILLAEDSETNAYVAQALLRHCGARVDHVTDGAQAVAAFQNNRYDLVLMDVSMPVVDGIEATARIKADPECGDVPIVAMTAHVGEEDWQRCREVGMCDRITKPIDQNAFLSTVARWVKPGTSHAPSHVSSADGAVEKALPESMLDVDRFTSNWRGLDSQVRLEIISIFREECENRVIKLGAGTLDRQAASREAHSLKSASANVGAFALSEAAADLEAAYISGADAGPVLARVLEISTATLDDVMRIQSDERYWQLSERAGERA